jgi:hypothetical protein
LIAFNGRDAFFQDCLNMVSSISGDDADRRDYEFHGPVFREDVTQGSDSRLQA